MDIFYPIQRKIHTLAHTHTLIHIYTHAHSTFIDTYSLAECYGVGRVRGFALCGACTVANAHCYAVLLLPPLSLSVDIA